MLNQSIPTSQVGIDLEHADPAALLRESKEILIRERTIREQSFNNWYNNNLLKCPETVLSRIPFDYKGWTLQSLIPEWYEEVPNEEIAKKQLDEANAKIDQINDIMRDIYKQALIKQAEFKKLYG